MVLELSSIIYYIASYIVVFFLSVVVLWQISKRQKLKKHDFKTAFFIFGISYIVGFIFYGIYQLITFHILIQILIGIATLILILFLIKRFYNVSWGKSIKLYLLTILFSFLIVTIVSLIFFTLYFILKLIIGF